MTYNDFVSGSLFSFFFFDKQYVTNVVISSLKIV